MSAPVEHLQEALKLEADAYVDLWEIRLRSTPTIARFRNGSACTWQDMDFEGLACQLQGEGQSTEGQHARPTLTVANPEKIFGPFAAAGYFDLAEVIRRRVLQQHLQNDVNIFQQRVWICGRPVNVTPQTLTLELRSPTDIPLWKTPRRTYSPPGPRRSLC